MMSSVSALLPVRSRELALEELEILAAQLADRSDLWQAHVRHERDRRHYVHLHRDPQIDVWLICWDAEQETGLHDHDRSSGAVSVVRGTLLEDWLAQEDGAIRLATRTHEAGSLFSFESACIHDVRHAGDEPAISIHVYSPALWRMGHYAFGPQGLRRVSMSYLEEVAA